jgi:hypothetical protein
VVNKALRQGHRRRVQQATEEGPRGMWQLAKWARSRRGAYESGITPTLQSIDGRTAETVEAKTALLSESFFPAIPEANLADIDNAIYPEQLLFPEIPRHEIERVIRSTPADKAPGEDGISNSFWHNVIGHRVDQDTERISPPRARQNTSNISIHQFPTRHHATKSYGKSPKIG